jgi:glycosyltransferase involved in cell wall biosynthesis
MNRSDLTAKPGWREIRLLTTMAVAMEAPCSHGQTDMPQRIAHFVHRYPPALGGSEAYFARLSRHLAGAGHEVTVFTTNADALEAFWLPKAASFSVGHHVEDGVRVRRYGLSLRFRGRRWLLKPLSLIPQRNWQCLTVTCNPFVWNMWRDAGRIQEQFDLVHATAFPYAFPILCARRLAKRLGVPFFLTPFLHLGDPLNPRDRSRRVYTSSAMMSLARSADVVFAQTPSERAALIQRGVAAERVVLQGLGVDTAECTGGNRLRARQAWEASDEEILVGHLANNSVEKGTVDLLKAAAELWRQGHRFRLVLAGPQMPSFVRFWQGYEHADKVRCLGRLTEEKKREFFAGLDVFALPSRSDSFGLVLLEAWANGLPNVAYRAGGIADVIQHEQDGLLAPCGDVNALAAALGRLVTDAETRRRLGTAGRRRVSCDFRWHDKLEQVAQAYREHHKRWCLGATDPLSGERGEPINDRRSSNERRGFDA